MQTSCEANYARQSRSFFSMRIKVLFLIFVAFSLSLSIETVFAQDPIYCRRLSRHHQHYYARLVSSSSPSRPWKHQRHQQQRRSPSAIYQEDFSSHFLQPEQVLSDERCRLYQPNLKSRRPGVLSLTSWLVRANIAAYIAQVFYPQFTQWGLQIQERIFTGGEYRRLVTPVFLHGGIAHLAVNMMSLLRVGPDLQKLFGPGRFLTTYMVAGVAGNVLSAVRSPNPSLGASGAVFGVVGAYYVFLNRNEWLLGSSGQAMADGVTQTILGNLVIGAINPVIDNWGHLGGMLGGAAAAYWFGPRLYLMDSPQGRFVIDKPIFRLPRSLESLPERIGQDVKRMTQRIPIGRSFQSDEERPMKPWQQQRMQQQIYRRRPPTPNRSIKPGKVD